MLILSSLTNHDHYEINRAAKLFRPPTAQLAPRRAKLCAHPLTRCGLGSVIDEAGSDSLPACLVTEARII